MEGEDKTGEMAHFPEVWIVWPDFVQIPLDKNYKIWSDRRPSSPSSIMLSSAPCYAFPPESAFTSDSLEADNEHQRCDQILFKFN